PAAAADRKFDPEARAKAVAPFLDDRAVLVAHIDLARIDADALIARLADTARLDVKDLAVPRQNPARLLADLTKPGAHDVSCICSLADLPGVPFVVFPLEAGAGGKNIGERLEQIQFIQDGKSETVGSALVYGSAATLKRLQNIKAVPNADLARAFTA